MNAMEWTKGKDVCYWAIQWLKIFPFDITMASAWDVCHRGDWMVWALGRHPEAEKLYRGPIVEIAELYEKKVKKHRIPLYRNIYVLNAIGFLHKVRTAKYISDIADASSDVITVCASSHYNWGTTTKVLSTSADWLRQNVGNPWEEK
jgi:hypothetical protein